MKLTFSDCFLFRVTPDNVFSHFPIFYIDGTAGQFSIRLMRLWLCNSKSTNHQVHNMTRISTRSISIDIEFDIRCRVQLFNGARFLSVRRFPIEWIDFGSLRSHSDFVSDFGLSRERFEHARNGSLLFFFVMFPLLWNENRAKILKYWSPNEAREKWNISSFHFKMEKINRTPGAYASSYLPFNWKYAAMNWNKK